MRFPFFHPHGALVGLVAVGCHAGFAHAPVVLPAGTYQFRAPEALCPGAPAPGSLFSAIIARPNALTGREDPAIPPGTIGVFEMGTFAADNPKLVRVHMREVVVQGRHIAVSDAPAESDVTGISLPARPDTSRSPICLPAGSPFVGAFETDVVAR